MKKMIFSLQKMILITIALAVFQKMDFINLMQIEPGTD